MDVIKSGFKTSELAFTGLVGAAIYDLAKDQIDSIPKAIIAAASVLSLGYMAGKFIDARTQAKKTKS